MSDENKSGWFTNLIDGVFSLISTGHSTFDRYVKTLVTVVVLFLLLTILASWAGSAVGYWVDVLGIDTAASAVSSAFSEAVQQNAPAPSSPDIPYPNR